MRKIFAIFVFSLICCSCNPHDAYISRITESPTPTLIFGTGGITGYIQTPNPIDQRGLIVYLATTISYGEETGGFLDLARSPFSHVQDNGYFMIYNVAPGDYILVVYEVVMGGKALQGENGELIVIHIEKGEIVDLGIVNFEW